jgi:hypothetical protein
VCRVSACGDNPALDLAPHLHHYDLTLLIVPLAFFLKWAGDVVAPATALALVGLGMLSLINTVAYPYLPPLLPLVLLVFLIVDSDEHHR